MAAGLVASPNGGEVVSGLVVGATSSRSGGDGPERPDLTLEMRAGHGGGGWGYQVGTST